MGGHFPSRRFLSIVRFAVRPALHCRRCTAGGDLTVCHNRARNIVCRFAEKAGFNTTVEEPHLLPPRPDDPTGSNLRRPADVYAPSWFHGNLLHSTLRSHRRSGRRSLTRRPARLDTPPSLMKPESVPTLIRRRTAANRGSYLSPWWLRRQAAGGLRPSLLSGKWLSAPRGGLGTPLPHEPSCLAS